VEWPRPETGPRQGQAFGGGGNPEKEEIKMTKSSSQAQPQGRRWLVFFEPVRFGVIIGAFLWVARSPFGLFHPNDENWLFFWRWPPLWQLWVLIAVSVVGISALLVTFLFLRGRRSEGRMDEARRSFRRVASPIYFLLLGLIQLVPGALGVLPVIALLNKLILPLAVFSSVLFLFVIETGFVPSTLGQKLDRSASRHKWRWTILLFLVSWAAYGVFTKRCDTAYGYTSGDEAHYLTQAQSLAEDLDRDLANQLPDYERSRMYYVAKHLSAKSPPGKAYSYHSIGLPVLLAPGWAVDKVKGAVGVLITISSVFAVTFFWIAFKLRGSAVFALCCWAIFCFTTPIIFYACRAYPELPSALVILVVVWKMMRAEKLRPWGWFGLACLLGYLPWLHIPRLSLPTLFLSLWGIVWIFFRGRKKNMAFFVPPLLVSVALLIILNQHWYGYEWDAAPGARGFERLDPQAWTGGYYHEPRELFSCFPGLIGTFIDRYRGLLVNSPAYLVPLVGVLLGLFSRRMKFWRGVWFWTFLVIYVPALGRRGWYGGACFPSRFLISALPLLLFPFASVLSVRRDKLLRALFAVLAAFSVWITLGMLLNPVAFYRGVETAYGYSSAVKLVVLFYPYVWTGHTVYHIEDPYGILLFLLWFVGVLALIRCLKRKEMAWHRVFHLAIAAIVALPLLSTTIRRLTHLPAYGSAETEPLGHFSGLISINRPSSAPLHAARWGRIAPEVLTEQLTLELLAAEQKSRTGDVETDESTGQKVVAFRPGTDKAGYLSYTYPLKLHRGDWVAFFSLSLDGWDGENAVVVDVQDMETGRAIASRRVEPSDIRHGGGFEQLPVRFSLDHDSKLSFRIYVDARNTVRILKYSLQPGCLPELLAAMGRERRE
jgi:hypothetical protein